VAMVASVSASEARASPPLAPQVNRTVSFRYRAVTGYTSICLLQDTVVGRAGVGGREVTIHHLDLSTGDLLHCGRRGITHARSL
jgi:hypothetical protein